MSAAQFRLHSVHVAAFTPNHEQFVQSKVLSALVSRYAARYDGEMTVLPTKPDRAVGAVQIKGGGVTPIALQSEDKRWRLNCAPDRAESVWMAVSEEDGSRPLAEICNKCLSPLFEHPVNGNVQVGRLGIVVRRTLPNVEHPAVSLVKHFCRDHLGDDDNPRAPLRNSRSFQLHNLKRFHLPNDLEVNSWVRFVGLDGTSNIQLEQDVNTLAEDAEATSFTVDDVRDFFDAVPDEMNKIVKLYECEGEAAS